MLCVNCQCQRCVLCVNCQCQRCVLCVNCRVSEVCAVCELPGVRGVCCVLCS